MNQKMTPTSKPPSKLAQWLSRASGMLWLRTVKIVAGILLVVLLVFYSAAALFTDQGGFTVSIKDAGKGNAKYGAISLSETADFASPTVRLEAQEVARMTNISGLDIPVDVDNSDGAHNGENYMAYTFYLKNSGEAACDVLTELRIDGVVKEADEAVRVKVYKNGTPTTYAKLAADGAPEPGTTPFEGGKKVLSELSEDLAPGEITKYTIVIWLEGNDPECLDNIKGGSVKMSLMFSVVEGTETQSET